MAVEATHVHIWEVTTGRMPAHKFGNILGLKREKMASQRI